MCLILVITSLHGLLEAGGAQYHVYSQVVMFSNNVIK